MKNTHPSRRFIPTALPGISLCILASGFLACQAFAANTATPAPASPSPKEATGAAAAPPLGDGGSSSPGSPSTLLHGITVSAGTEATGSGVIGRVGNTVVTVKDLRTFIDTLSPEEQAAMTSDPAMIKRVLLSMMVERVVMHEVDARKWDQQPDVQARLARVKQTATAEFYLKSVSTPPDSYPSDADLKAAYEARKTSFNVPHKFLISQIFVSLADGDKIQAKIEDIHQSLMQPNADFGAIAHAKSDDAKGAEQNGSMGWITDDKMPPRIRIQAILLPKNAVSAPIRLDDGWHIIKVLDSTDVRPLAFDEVKIKLAQQLRAERAQAERQAYIDKLLQANPITVDDKALPQVMVPEGQPGL